jgi:putative ABC transport system permease protein
MGRWLEGFAYHTTVGVWPFAGALLASLLIAAATVSGHALRAAQVNPATTIRTE